jgi:hypothetical protein
MKPIFGWTKFGWTKRVEDLNSHTALRGNNAVCAVFRFN